jgi:signal transduction histidine kinase
MKLLPRSLFSRLVIVFLVGLIVAQGVSLAIVLQDRGEFLSRASGVQSLRRIADTVILFDTVSVSERDRLVKLLSSPAMRIVISSDLPRQQNQRANDSPQASMFASVLQRMLGRNREIRLIVLEPQESTSLVRHRNRLYASVIAQIRLEDGNWATFDSQLQPETWTWPYRALLSALVLIAAVILLAVFGVRWVTRPLKNFALAATELGKNINRPPLAETGPQEVVQAARALNGMQARLSRYLHDRTRILAAMSHDLKTPITRMRLRAELLDDEPIREKFTRDLTELEAMVTGTLDYMRGIETSEPIQPLDINALLESLQDDAQELGHSIEIIGSAAMPFSCRPQSIKRCLSNLLENAIKYGGATQVRVIQLPASLHLIVSDQGPGVPVQELERLFDPFYRLEPSRNRDHGGTGLGLTIARSIAEQHGGTLVLKNGVKHGLECHLDFPVSS